MTVLRKLGLSLGALGRTPRGTDRDRHPRSQALLAGIVLLGFALRIWHLDYDQGMGSHPDERSNSYYAVTIRMPSDVTDLLHPRRSPLNPLWDTDQNRKRHFTYGHFPLYLGVLAATVAHNAAPLLEALGMPDPWVDAATEARSHPRSFLLAGRIVIVLLDTLTIWLLYLTAHHLYGNRTGLLTAFLWAIAVMPFKDSHFFTVDIALTTFVTLTILGFLTLLDKPLSYRGIGLTGIGMGLSVASKFSAFPIVFLFAGLSLLQWRRHTAKAARAEQGGMGRMLGMQFLAVVGIAVGTFALTSPFVLLDWDIFRFAVLEQQGNMVTGVNDWPFTRQYRGTLPYWYFIQQQLQWGLWYPLGLAALAGTLWTVLRLGALCFRRQSPWLPRPLDGEWLIVLWIVLYFGPTGAFLAKFNRYALPLLPSVVLLGTGLLAWSCHWWGARSTTVHGPGGHGPWAWSSLARTRVGTACGVLVVAGSLFWLGANINGIYARNHTWHDASHWIFHNVPDGSVILWEQWDDPLPKSWQLLRERDASVPQKHFRKVDWNPFAEEDEQKLALLKGHLLEADYVIFSSRRTYGAIPRLPQRYPLVTRYYELLFNGALGFEIVHRETRSPRALGLHFDDTLADESWRLYDHPPVTILAKVRPLTGDEIESLLQGQVDSAVKWFVPSSPFPTSVLASMGLSRQHDSEQPARAGKERNFLRRTLGPVLFGVPHFDVLDYPLASSLPFDRFRFNTFGSTRTWAATLIWWAGLWLMGLIAWPLGYPLWARLPDAGYALSRSFGWLGLALIVWWIAHLGVSAFTVRGVWVTVLALLVFSGIMAWRQRHELMRHLRRHWRLLLCAEVGFTLAYVLFVFLRLCNPDLWQPWTGGEKFMDLAILNGILHSPTFPPMDPHFAGKFLNYYYWGHYLVAFQIKMTGLWTEVAYNVALASLFALVVLLSWSCVFYFHMRPRVRDQEAAGSRAGWRPALVKALWAPFLVTGIGNLEGASQLLRSANSLAQGTLSAWPALLRQPAETVHGLWQMWSSGSAPGYDFWGPSRVIPHTINEFPYWGFLFGDLHAHLLVMPITLLLLCCIVFGSCYLQGKGQASVLLVLVAVISSIGIATNLWELPLYISLVLLWLFALGQRYFPRAWPAAGGGAALLVLFVALLALLPFWRQFEIVSARGLGWVQQGDSPSPWFRIWGLFYAVVLVWLLLHLLTSWSEQPWASRKTEVRGLGFLVVIAVTSCLLWQRTTLALVMPLLLLAAWLLWKKRQVLRSEQALILGWLLLVLGIWASTQLVFVRDFLEGGDAYRMNTLFKFFLQAWILAAVTVAMLLPGLGRRAGRILGPNVAWTSRAGFGILLAASLVYPLMGTPARLAQRFPDNAQPIGTLNGLDYMHTGTYRWPDQHNEVILAYDRQAIDWLNSHISRNLVILESHVLDYYRAAGTRIASHTGLPGLLGMHQIEQRPVDLVRQRSSVMYAIWNAVSAERMLQLLTEHAIDLVYAGQLEQMEHPQGVRHLAELYAAGQLELVYENPKTRVYALPGQMRSTFE